MSIFTHPPITHTPGTIYNADCFNQEIKEKMDDLDKGIKSKLITATRDMAAVSGDVAYTGVGFTPVSIYAMGAINASLTFCVGFADSLKIASVIDQYNTNAMEGGFANLLRMFLIGGSAGQYAIVKSYDDDGFTLTWTKISTPTGTAQLSFLCFR